MDWDQDGLGLGDGDPRTMSRRTYRLERSSISTIGRTGGMRKAP
jgi:hypothetical protein